MAGSRAKHSLEYIILFDLPALWLWFSRRLWQDHIWDWLCAVTQMQFGHECVNLKHEHKNYRWSSVALEVLQKAGSNWSLHSFSCLGMFLVALLARGDFGKLGKTSRQGLMQYSGALKYESINLRFSRYELSVIRFFLFYGVRRVPQKSSNKMY